MNKFNGEHYWEIGKAGYPLQRIIDDIRKTGFNVKRTCRVFECPYHRFFVLKKRNLLPKMHIRKVLKEFNLKIETDKLVGIWGK